MKIKRILIIILSLGFLSCDELTGSHTGANDLSKFLGQSQENQKNPSPSTIGGVVFSKLSDDRYLLNGVSKNGGDIGQNFQLVQKYKENSSVSYRFFANRNLENGIELLIKTANSQTELKLTINGVSHEHIIDNLDKENVSLSIDIHNDHENAAHVLIWKLNGPFGDQEECVDPEEEEEACLYNTEFFTDPNPGPWGGQGKGQGANWGIVGNPAVIIKLEGPLEAKSDA